MLSTVAGVPLPVTSAFAGFRFPENLRQSLEGFRAAFPDVTLTVDNDPNSLTRVPQFVVTVEPGFGV